jgi:hypothetical protein
MAMKKSGTGSGGGIGSKNVVHKPVITGKPASGVRPGWASQIGSAIGDHITDHGGRNLSYRGEEMKLPRGPAGGNAALGNQLGQRFRGSNHIRRPRQACRTKCG